MRLSYFLLALFFSVTAFAAPEKYAFDIKGQHAFIQFKIKHLGYSWLLGEFNRFDGEFIYDAEALANSSVRADIDVSSIDSNHKLRDKHLRDKDFLDVAQYPKASFISRKIIPGEGGSFLIVGDLNLKGVTKSIEISAREIGRGPDPWMGYRAGFEGEVELTLADFNIVKDLGPSATKLMLYLYIEGVRVAKEDSDLGSEFFE